MDKQRIALLGAQSFVIFAGPKHVPFANCKQLGGCYKGTREVSFLAPSSEWHAARTLALNFNQESVLLLGPKRHRDAHRPAILHYLDDRLPEPLGYFVPVSREFALAREAWTYDPADDQYYVCLPDPSHAE